MDKKTQKRIAILREKLQRLRQSLAGVKSQTDEPDEIQRVENEIRKTQTELDVLLER